MMRNTLFRSWIAFTAVVATGGALSVAAAAAVPVPALHRASTSSRPAEYALNQPACPASSDPRLVRCLAMRRVPVAEGTRGAIAVPRQSLGAGPSGGYTPAELATLYGYNPKTKASSQTVAVVDAFDDPDASSDLKAFDTQYGLPAETPTSFRKLNQAGNATALPKTNADWSGEIALDVESVRAVCNTCRILLVEANDETLPDLAAAENTAARLGATEISNSFGFEETTKQPASVLAGFNHPGIVITASSGDSGWYDWDQHNLNAKSGNAPLFPASDPDVIAVGGTEITPTATGTRHTEDVWNEAVFHDDGAGGGGCSHFYAAPSWQIKYPGYAATGCKGMRSAVDIAADGDPESGFDIRDSYQTSTPWQTIGGTSLASPLIAALFALAGGAGSARYPASSLYVNGSHRASSLFDVVLGGNGFCGYNSDSVCSNYTSSKYGNTNPNGIGLGNIDCSFPRNATPVTTVPTALNPECNAATGFDGPTGLGTPNGIGVFTNTSPTVTITHPATARAAKAESFTATAKEPVSGTRVVSYAWNWGDKKTTTTTSATTRHTFAKPGRYTVTLTITDSRYQVVTRTSSVTVTK